MDESSLLEELSSKDSVVIIGALKDELTLLVIKWEGDLGEEGVAIVGNCGICSGSALLLFAESPLGYSSKISTLEALESGCSYFCSINSLNRLSFSDLKCRVVVVEEGDGMASPAFFMSEYVLGMITGARCLGIGCGGSSNCKLSKEVDGEEFVSDLFLVVGRTGVLVDGGEVEAAALACSNLAAKEMTDFFFFGSLVSIESDIGPCDWGFASEKEERDRVDRGDRVVKDSKESFVLRRLKRKVESTNRASVRRLFFFKN